MDDQDAKRRLAELEAEVRGTAAARERARIEEQVAAQAERLRRDELLLEKTRSVKRRDEHTFDTMALVTKAAKAKHELARPREKGEKSWFVSGVASLLLGPLGWLYAGSWREAMPASALYVLLMAVATKIIPLFLLMPVLSVVLPLSGVAGVVYAIGHNRENKRIRLFGDADETGDNRVGKLGSGDDESQR